MSCVADRSELLLPYQFISPAFPNLCVYRYRAFLPSSVYSRDDLLSPDYRGSAPGRVDL